VALPVISGRKAIKALAKIGFEVNGKKGSHIKLKKKFNGKVLIVIVPDHRELASDAWRKFKDFRIVLVA
jgi:predicted RNA binding protein YcfA (HicA-like mRNA interferase family)